MRKTTVYRLANQMSAVGWLERTSDGYRVGPKVLEGGDAALQRNGLREAAFSHIYALAAKTGLAVHLAILDRDEVIYLDRIVPTRFGRATRVGGREPAYCTALRKPTLHLHTHTSQPPKLDTIPP